MWNGSVIERAAIAAVLGLCSLGFYSEGAVAQTDAARPETKRDQAATPPAPPSCSFQTPCIENPVTGQRYQVDAAGKMTTIN